MGNYLPPLWVQKEIISLAASNTHQAAHAQVSAHPALEQNGWRSGTLFFLWFRPLWPLCLQHPFPGEFFTSCIEALTCASSWAAADLALPCLSLAGVLQWRRVTSSAQTNLLFASSPPCWAWAELFVGRHLWVQLIRITFANIFIISNGLCSWVCFEWP